MHLAMLEHGKSSLLHSLFWGNPFGKIHWEKLIIQERILSWVSKWDQEEYCVGCDTGSQEFKKCFQWAIVFERKQKKNKIRSRLKCGWVHSPQVWEAVGRLHQFFSTTVTFPFSLLNQMRVAKLKMHWRCNKPIFYCQGTWWINPFPCVCYEKHTFLKQIIVWLQGFPLTKEKQSTGLKKSKKPLLGMGKREIKNTATR